MLKFILVMIGGSCGAMARTYFTDSLTRHPRLDVLRATVLINSLGAFLLGLVVALSYQTSLYFLLGVGFLGGFTTFSTFQVELATLHQKHYRKRAYFTLIGATLIGLALAFLGFQLGNSWPV